MARTQSADYGEKRAAITATAARLFAAKGFDGASLADLGAACGVSKSLLYHYYESKEAILYDLMRGHMEELLAAIDPLTDETVEPAAAFRRFARALLARYAGAADRQKILLYEIARLPTAERADIVARERKLIAHAERLLAAALPHAGADRARLRARAMLFFGMLNWTHTWMKPGGKIARDEIADLAADLALGG